MMNNASQADILVYGRGVNPLAIVEVKNIHRLSRSQAADIRQAVLESRAVPTDEAYLLVVSQEVGYLWEPGRDATDPPDAQFDMREVIEDYLTARELGGRLRGAELELAILQWLSDLSRGRGRVPVNDRAIAGLAGTIRGARIEGGSRL